MAELTKGKSNLLLVAITIIWGSGFVVTKLLLNMGVPSAFVTAIRGCGVMVLGFCFFHKKIIHAPKRAILVGFIAGITNAAAFIFQTVGLEYTTPSTSAFLTILHIVFVPIIALIFFRKRVKIQIIISVFIALIGAFVISGMTFSSLKMGIGELITLLGALSFGISIAYIGNKSYGIHPGVIAFYMGVVQFLTSLVYYFVFDYSQNGFVPFDYVKAILPLLYLTVVGSFFTTNLQVVCQKVTDEMTSSLIMSLEAVFGTVIALIFGYDKLSLNLLLGGAVILLAVMLAIVKFPKKSKKR